MPGDLFNPSNAFPRPRKMLSIPTMPHARQAYMRRPFGPRADKPRPTITLTVATLVLILPIAMLTLLSSNFHSPIRFSSSTATAGVVPRADAPPDWVRASNVVPHSASNDLAAVGAPDSDVRSAVPDDAPPLAAHPDTPALRDAEDPDRAASEGAPVVVAAAPPQPASLVRDEAADPPPPAAPVDAAPPAIKSDAGGVQPPSLPDGHPQASLLDRIRARTPLRPRWPEKASPNVPLLRSFGPAYSSIMVSYKLKVVYVPVFKVGTSSMMWHIAYLENNEHVVPHKGKVSAGKLQYLLHEMDSPAWRGRAFCHMKGAQVRELLRDPSFLKFGFVRNPYDRTVSAYLDKVMSMPMDSWEYQEQMYGMYGHDAERRAAVNATRPTFAEFLTAVHGVIKSPRTPTTDLDKDEAYETNASRRDLHWRPQVELLHPDLIHLDFVGKFDNLVEDRQVVLDWMYQFTERRMPKSGQRIHSTNPADKVAIFKQLRENKQLRELLLDAYKDDFDRFNFSRDVPDVNTKL